MAGWSRLGWPGRIGAALMLWATAAAADPAPSPGGEPGEQAPAFQEPARLEPAASLAGSADRATLLVRFGRKVATTLFVLERPDRIVVDTDAATLPTGTFRPVPGLVRAVRTGLNAPGRTRIVVDLLRPATARPSDEAGGTVLAVEIAPTSREAFHRAAGARGADPDTTGSLAPVPAPPERRPVVAIDAGHGGDDTGARAGSGLLEKNLTLAFARALRDALGRYEVVMTRDEDAFVPLDQRVERARAAGAELFISIHADSIGRPSVAGATVYTGAERATDLESAKFAERENLADRAGGRAAPPREVAGILQDLTVRETRGFSHRFAGLLLTRLAPAIRLNERPHREAGFRVLRAADMPAVLVELGYLSNAREANLMATEAWRRRTVAAMSGALDRFFASRGERGAAVSP